MPNRPENPWGDDGLMAVAAFRYCCGRQSYIVGMCADWIIAHWPEFPPNVRALIERNLEEEFMRDDAVRAQGNPYLALGRDCDRREWERVRKLWVTNA